jgi:hypothetical protein
MILSVLAQSDQTRKKMLFWCSLTKRVREDVAQNDGLLSDNYSKTQIFLSVTPLGNNALIGYLRTLTRLNGALILM